MRYDTASVGKLFGKSELPEGMSVFRQSDLITSLVTIITAFVGLAVTILSILDGQSISHALPYLSIPLIACGCLFFLRWNYWILIGLTAFIIVLYALGASELIFYVGCIAAFGIVGVVYMADVMVRFVFYRAMRAVECVSMPKKAHMKERILTFMFDLPKGLDTRDLMSNWKMRRNDIPWKDTIGNVIMSLMVGVVFWICIILDRGRLMGISAEAAALSILSVMVFVPLLILPLVLFRSLNIRIVANNGDVQLFGGIMSTMMRTVIPLIAVLIIAVLTVGKVDATWVIVSIIISASSMAVIMVCSSILYYRISEPSLINDINQKWRMFRPVTMMATADGKEGSRLRDIPGTPVRDKSEYGTLTLPNGGHSKS